MSGRFFRAFVAALFLAELLLVNVPMPAALPAVLAMEDGTTAS